MPRIWAARGLAAFLLLPLAALFALVVAVRRRLYARGALRSQRLRVPVVVVGNITVGGSGKTPLVLALALALRSRGMRPAIVSRGYGGRKREPRQARPQDAAGDVGDEPLLLARRAACPVWVGADRVAAVRALLAAHPDCDVVIADDGLQHYRLARDLEIAVLDERGFGNGWPLPAGPLREPVRRLDEVDALVLNAGSDTPSGVTRDAPRFRMRLSGGSFYRIGEPGRQCAASDLAGKRLHALAGIGNPERFFEHLRRLGLDFEAHAFPDHHRFTSQDLAFVSGDTLLMTEKDAVKCAAIAPDDTWVLPVYADIDPDLAQFVVEKLHGSSSARHPRVSGDQGTARI